MSKVLAVLTSDWHLTLETPVAKAEQDWLAVQKRYLDQVKAIAEEHSCPIVVAGDYFNAWNPGPELLNWCLKNVPNTYAVWGQHDLRHHNAADVDKTGFWNLVLNGKITPILPGQSMNFGRLVLHGFPWGEKIVPHGMERKGKIHLAVCHRYVWDRTHTFPGASDDNYVSTVADELIRGGYDAAVIGDNHNGFHHRQEIAFPYSAMDILISGTFIRRKRDERECTPCVGLLDSDGSIRRRFLETVEDKWVDLEGKVESLLSEGDVGSLVEELKNLGDGGLNFLDALRHALSSLKVPASVREIVLKCAEGKK